MSRAEPLGAAFPARRQRTAGATSDRDSHATGAPSAAVSALRAVLPEGITRPRLLRGPRLDAPVDAHPIHTERLVLRQHRLSDADAWFHLQSTPEVIEHLPWPVRDRAASREHLRHRTRHSRLWQSDDFLALAVEREGRLIGDVSLHLRQVRLPERSAEIGWVLDPAASGHGYATEAAEAMLDIAFEEVGAGVVTAVIEPGNVRSVSLAERLGFLRTSAPRRSSSITFAITPALLAARRAERATREH